MSQYIEDRIHCLNCIHIHVLSSVQQLNKELLGTVMVSISHPMEKVINGLQTTGHCNVDI